MDQAVKAEVMSSEYKGNDGMATELSKQVQSAADRNEPGETSELKTLH